MSIICPLCEFSCKSVKGLSKHISQKHFEEQEQAYLKFYNLTEVLCKTCPNQALFLSFSKGYKNFCSDACKKLQAKEACKDNWSKVDKDSRLEKSKKTNLERYGVDNPAKSEIVQSKIKQTCIERYNSTSPLGNVEIRDKIKKTNTERYGFDWGLSSNEVKEKKKNTVKERYGVENVFQSEEVKARIQKTILENYQVANVSQAEGIKEKKRQTTLSNYGVEYPIQSKEIRNKIEETCLSLYKETSFLRTEEFKIKSRETSLLNWGVDHPLKSTTIREKIKNTNFEKYGGPTCFSDSTIFEKRKQTFLNNYGVENPFQLPEVRLKALKSVYDKLIARYLKTITPLFSFEDWISRDTELLKWRCNKCNKEFSTPLYCGNTPRCLSCYPLLQGRSNLEKEVVEFTRGLIPNHLILENDRSLISPKELDLYLPDFSIAIEFDGLFWHSDAVKDKNYHLNKTKACLEKGVQLIHVFENEWIHKPLVVQSILASKLGVYREKIGARCCSVDTLTSKEAEIFYNENHLQGYSPAKHHFGLFFKGTLVSCISFSKPRFTNKYDWELVRFANKCNTKVHGSFSKLWKHKPKGSIVAYSDKRYFTGGIYKKYMIQKEDSPPAYWYFNKEGVVYNRMKFQKHKLHKLLKIFDSNKTEWENMQENGYNRIWDCGNFVFEYFPNNLTI